MITKYDTEIDNKLILEDLRKLVNQTYKLLPSKEEGLDWKTPLSTITEEVAGMNILFKGSFGLESLTFLNKMEGLVSLDEEDFFNFRRTIFECLNLLNRIKDYVESR